MSEILQLMYKALDDTNSKLNKENRDFNLNLFDLMPQTQKQKKPEISPELKPDPLGFGDVYTTDVTKLELDELYRRLENNRCEKRRAEKRGI